jgi:hypothetical protein
VGRGGVHHVDAWIIDIEELHMTNEYSFKQTGQLAILDLKPNYNISFHNNSEGGTGKEVGKLDFNGPALVFTGDAEESAKVFIDWIASSFAGRLEEERKAERDRLAKECALLPFGDTAASFAVWIKNGGKA